jgi:hypothetical protein
VKPTAAEIRAVADDIRACVRLGDWHARIVITRPKESP